MNTLVDWYTMRESIEHFGRLVHNERECGKNTKVVAYSIMSIGHRADPGFLAVSPQVTLVINPVVGCRYFSLPLASSRLCCLVTEAHRCK